MSRFLPLGAVGRGAWGRETRPRGRRFAAHRASKRERWIALNPSFGIGRYLTLYNTRRPHSSLADRTPDEAYFFPLPLSAAA